MKKKRLFVSNEKYIIRGITVDPLAYVALQHVAKMDNTNVSKIVGDLIEDYLSGLVREGSLPPPDQFDPVIEKKKKDV